jgi:hypothetical protein
MTEHILKEIDTKLAHIAEMRNEMSLIGLTTTENYIKALRVAVNIIDDIERYTKEQGVENLCAEANFTIATILGLKGDK